MADLTSDFLGIKSPKPLAWQQAFTTHAERLSKLKNAIMAGRAADLRDLDRLESRFRSQLARYNAQFGDQALDLLEEALVRGVREQAVGEARGAVRARRARCCGTRRERLMRPRSTSAAVGVRWVRSRRRPVEP